MVMWAAKVMRIEQQKNAKEAYVTHTHTHTHTRRYYRAYLSNIHYIQESTLQQRSKKTLPC